MMVIESILNKLKFEPDDFDETSIEETALYKFIIKTIGVQSNPGDYLKNIAAKSISCQLYRQNNYGSPNFEEDAIFALLVDKDDEEYKAIFEYIFGKIPHLEHHNINNVELFFGENLKIEYHLLLKIFATIITADLNSALEKVKKKLFSNVTITEWADLIIGGNGDYLEIELERMEGIINGVLK